VTATYRLQLHAGFTFADAEAVVPYLAELGISHVYLSPVLQAVPGSMHGYDVLDHTRISAELGGEEGLVRLAETARQHGLGVVVDVVPNHMALVAPESANAPLWDVLAHGRGAEHAHWFDVDWDALDGRIGLPVLWDPLPDVLAKGDLRLGEENGGQVLRYHDHVFPVAEGTWDGSGSADVAAVLSAQHYVLAGWRERDEVLNYRRFFDVDGLIAVRVELPDVFEATHRLLVDLNHRGIVEGYRIDHPDGLADPAGYLDRLRAALRPGTAIWVEKILEGDETLPDEWACDGTTGYDAAKVVSFALLDPATAPALQRAWEEVGGEPSLDPVVLASKRQVVAEVLAPERHRLVRRAHEALPDADPSRLEEAVAELLVACEVYRAYIRPGHEVDAVARRRLEEAGHRAGAARPDLKTEVEQLVELALDARDGEATGDFAVRLQQTWGPVMAKGIEDTAFYRWHRQVGLNEVGGDPALLDEATPDLMHRWAVHQQQRWPLGMTTLSTHDTKRSEDVRARLGAVSGDAETWQRCTEEFEAAARERQVDPPTAHLVWQTLVGAGDISGDRLRGYLTKAMRESKQRTSWLEPDPEYEGRVLDLATEVLGSGHLAALVRTAVDHNAVEIRAMVLGQKLLQLTLPGVPDTYQGCELVDLSLVDPDNRRPVDFDDRRARLAHLRGGGAPRDLDDEKLLVTHKALMLRRELRDSFADAGDYQPVVGTSRHLTGFVRGGEVAVLATRAANRLEAAGGWDDASFALPEGLWRDELTGVLHEGSEHGCADVLSDYPVALLRRVDLA
jgi:(1->4)-alpha-D-glucan 1-alpha-D-glucosylmutase